jgi:hypothetical protein
MILLGVLLLPVLLVGGCWARVRHQNYAAARFCESLIPKIEAAHAQLGRYPVHPDPAWWAGQPVPQLIDTQSFYFGYETKFNFVFQNDLALFDNVGQYDSTTKTWFSYDADRKK